MKKVHDSEAEAEQTTHERYQTKSAPDQVGTTHFHCQTCCKSQCARQSQTCPMLDCELQCGARFHTCKLSEHHLLCPLERVPCINQCNGCPIMLPRQQLGRHLERCPASVVCCTMEWNRWPVYAPERQARVPFKLSNIHANNGQLDVALAQRDQRMLANAMQAPSATRRALRNHLTRRFPAVPINIRHIQNVNPLHSDEEEEEDAEDEQEEGKRSPPRGRPQIMQLLEASKHASETLAAALSMVNESQTGNHGDGCHSNATCDSDDKMTDKKPESVDEDNTQSADDEPCYGVASTYVPMPRPPQLPQLPQVQGVWINRAIPSDGRTQYRIPEPPPPPMQGLNLREVLALDLNLEQITRYQAKPKSMYTFLCAQNFRRDEYSWHFVNVHSEIHGGLSGWLEHRCPLAHYGCTFSQRRLHPEGSRSQVIYSPLVESFGVTNQPQSVSDKEQVEGQQQHTDNTNRDSLLVLPFEVLRYLAQFLDGYSLCNLSLTCTLLRDVCCSLLENRGVVIQEWEPEQRDGRQRWDITYKRWLFSTAFSPIRRWQFDEHPSHMSNHLRECVYNQPADPLPHPVPLPGNHGVPIEPHVEDMLKKMYPGVDISRLNLPLEKPAAKTPVSSTEPQQFKSDIVIEGRLDNKGRLNALVLPQNDFDMWARAKNLDSFK